MSEELVKPGQILDGKYRIVRLLGTGGMGAVYEGENVRIRRKVAIKMLHGSVSSQADVIARFEREAQAAALVGSEHICEVLDLGELPDQTRYMVMEYLEGDTFSGLIKRSGRLKPQQSIPILLQILDALGAAHAAGIVHRDLKPDNVFILPQKSGMQNFVKILDFGVSKFSQMGGEAMNVTRAGAVVGTPYYMSPEQARGSSAIDQRTDIYAIGVLLYQATTGQVPYQAETFNELLFKIVLEVAPPPQTYVPDLDPEFANIILTAMAREPEQRYQSCQQFRDALARFQASRANPLPAYQLPTFHDDHNQLPTQVLGGPGAPPPGPPSFSGAGGSWSGVAPLGGYPPPPAPAAGLGASGPGVAPSPVQSGQWAAASVSGAAAAVPLGGAPATASTTANSWGNASSPSVAAPTKPKSSGGMIAGVVAVAALLGIGGAVVAFVALGKGSAPAAQTVGDSTGKPAVTAAPSSAPIPSATAAATTTPSASATAADTAASSAAPVSTGAEPPPVDTAKTAAARTPGPMPTGASPTTTKAVTGTTKKPPAKGGKPAAGDLGY
jgi:serine/threonine-protein kinase